MRRLQAQPFGLSSLSIDADLNDFRLSSVQDMQYARPLSMHRWFGSRMLGGALFKNAFLALDTISIHSKWVDALCFALIARLETTFKLN